MSFCLSEPHPSPNHKRSDQTVGAWEGSLAVYWGWVCLCIWDQLFVVPIYISFNSMFLLQINPLNIIQLFYYISNCNDLNNTVFQFHLNGTSGNGSLHFNKKITLSWYYIMENLFPFHWWPAGFILSSVNVRLYKKCVSEM